MATFTATFEAADSRVRLTLTGATGAATATFYSRLQGTSAWNVVRGASAVPISAGEAPAVFDYEFPAGSPAAVTTEYRFLTNNAIDQTTTCAVTIAGQAWLKFPGYPFLNRALTVTARSSVTRGARGNLLPVVNTRAPLAVQEFMGGRACSVVARTTTWTAYKELDAALGIGGVVFLHSDEAALGLPSIYAIVQSAESEVGPRHNTQTRYTTIELAEVTQPGFAYAGTLGTYQTLLTNYLTYQLVLDAHLTYALLLELEGSPADVVVG